MFGLFKKSPEEDARWTARLKAGLARTRTALGGGLNTLLGRGRIDDTLYEALETALLTADCGVAATQAVLDALRVRVRQTGSTDATQVRAMLKEILLAYVQPLEVPLDLGAQRPFIMMVAGVNGTGKTTSIGKLARYFQSHDLRVLLAAGDTFRAAAREQLTEWGARNQVDVIAQQSGDAAAVMFDAVNAARARDIDVLIADTAGRLPTQLHLMEEIRKIRRVIQKAEPTAPHEVLLVLDANTGQNALAQVQAFDQAIGVTGLILTKLDGSARGGIVVALAHARAAQPQRPGPALRFIGVGEAIDDLRPFVAKDFVDALLE